ncbi:porin family protein [bacterium]|nr:porin family protein [bacterium]
MKGKIMPILLSAVLVSTISIPSSFAKDWVYGVGFRAGFGRLESDVRSPKLSPLISGHLRVLPKPHFAIDGELGFSALQATHPQFSDFKTVVVPFELGTIFNFLPYRKVNPYIFLGGGGVYWNATSNGNTVVANGENQNGLDSFLKTGGGFEFKLNHTLALNLGATYRFSFTEALDQLFYGDENDQVVDVHVGLTYYFQANKDKDRDVIPDELDLMPEIAEDRDGYLDHDGIPERNPNLVAMSGAGPIPSDASALSAPIVVHYLTTNSAPGKPIPLEARVYSSIALQMVAILYRPTGIEKWNVARMAVMDDNTYQAEIPAEVVRSPGVQYCVLAVDETQRGIGYAGLPSKPINVEVSSSGKGWKILGSTIGGAAVGTATYLILRKQN